MVMKTKLQLYEGMFIINASLSEDARKKALEKVTSTIEESGGTIHKIHEQGRKKLAYTIEKKKEGFYFVVFFDAPNNSLVPLRREFHLHEDLLRFLILRAEEVAEKIEFKRLEEE